MEAGDDPYHILGVPCTATAAEIRSAYRRLAIQHHPDKQRTPEDKERVTPLFVKISNAYELLSDVDERALYDRRQQQQQQSAAAAVDASFTHHHPFAFHDPFQLFAQLFQSQVAMQGGSLFQTSSMLGGNLFANMNQYPPMGMNNMMMNMGMGNMMMNTMENPFMNGIGGPSLGNFMSPLGMMNGGGMMGASSSMMTFASSSSSHTHVGTQSVSAKTTTQMVNGRRETRTERIIRHADGTTERIVETPDEAITNAHPRIAPEALEVSSDCTLASTESSSPKNSKRASSKKDTKKPKKRRQTNSPQEGDEDRPIELE